MFEYALKDLVINLTYDDDDIYLTPNYINSDNFKSINTTINNLSLYLEWDNGSYTDIRGKRHNDGIIGIWRGYYNNKYKRRKHLKRSYSQFAHKQLITNNIVLGQTYSFSINNIKNNINLFGNKFKIRIRGTYRYKQIHYYNGIGMQHETNAKTHIYSNVAVIEK